MNYQRQRMFGDVGPPDAKKAYKGRRYPTTQGYLIVTGDAPEWKKNKFMLEHRVVMKQMIGRHLHRHERVHHKNGDKTDNHPDNLELWLHSHPSGQRVSDRIRDAIRLLKEYADIAWLWPLQADELRQSLSSYDPNVPEEILELPPPKHVFKRQQLVMWG